MTFYTFMMRYRSGEGAKRDLACDMQDDKEHFPRNGSGKFDGWHRVLRGYLEDQRACDGCLEVFEECWKEYVKCEKARLKRSSSRKSRRAAEWQLSLFPPA